MAEKARVAVLISGRGSNMMALVEAARDLACPYEVVLVFSNIVDAKGLGHATAAGIATAALDHRSETGREAFDAKVDAILRAHRVQYVALAGYMRLLSAAFVARWRGRLVNIHPSLLPKYKGLDTHARAIAAGDSVAGCSVHLVTEALDEGEVLAQAEVPILAGDTPAMLAKRVLAAEHRLYPAALAELVSR
jgi:phosphoribosylglycinamide formyltransferase-1